MPILRLKEIANMSSEDRTKKIRELKTELSRLRTMINAGGAVENPAQVRDIRKTIARLLTIENEYAKGIRKTEGKSDTKKATVAPNKKPKEQNQE
ncbi:MAG: 50S ribosomal protein L29 [Candidatus Bathyarchaeota archaeon]|nr:50S ribosomal protein L29 [Candidatus Bathyarchaeota archaeon]